MTRSGMTVGKLLVCFAVMMALGGCGEPLTMYLVADHNPAEAKRVVVLPFLDVRTFRDENDPLNDRVAAECRDVFLAAMRASETFAGKEIEAPEFDRETDSLTAKQALGYGRSYGADLVIVGQVFSYTETRAASIPPRAGMFVRIFSVPEERLVFVGDHYLYAGAPGAEGGRRRQAELVSEEILKNYTAAAQGDIPDNQDGPRRVVTNVVELQAEDAPRVLVLPYHERHNSANLIEKTGGGAVVTSLFQMELAKLGSFQLISPASPRVSSSALLTPEEAIELAKAEGADFVVRGQVVEFRRAMSVPSLYSAIISTAILAAQVLFAETSGVDIATEVWRVEDGVCVFATRDIAKQKYVVQAERTIRRIANTTIPELASAISNPPADAVAPIIDSITVEEVIPEATAVEDTVVQDTTTAEPDVQADAKEETDKEATVADVEDEKVETQHALADDPAEDAEDAEDAGTDAVVTDQAGEHDEGVDSSDAETSDAASDAEDEDTPAGDEADAEKSSPEATAPEAVQDNTDIETDDGEAEQPPAADTEQEAGSPVESQQNVVDG